MRSQSVLSSAPKVSSQSVILSLREKQGSSYVEVLIFGRSICRVDLKEAHEGASITELAHACIFDCENSQHSLVYIVTQSKTTNEARLHVFELSQANHLCAQWL